MACGKGSGKSIIGIQLTKDNTDNLSKSWLVQKGTASGKDKIKSVESWWFAQNHMVIGVPWFLLELKHLATPEVMAFGKEIQIH